MTFTQRVMHSAKRRIRNLRGGPNLAWTKFPLVIQVDTNNHCGPEHTNMLCTYCYPQWKIQQGIRKHTEMPMEQIEWILEEISRDGKEMVFIDYFLNGDGQTEPRLPEILKLSKKICPLLWTQTFTTGALPENVGNLLVPELDSVCFTISAHNPTLYSKVHRGNNFEKALASLEAVLERRHPRQNVEVHCVITEQNFPYLKEWWDFFGKYDGLVRILSPLVASYDNEPSRNALGNLTIGQQEEAVVEVAGERGKMWLRDTIPDSKPCVLFDNMSIDVEGAILQCCNWSPPEDWNYGNLSDLMKEGRTLKQVWKERLANRMRNPLCRSCNMRSPQWRERLDAIQIGVEVQR